ncbi:MAG: hypothetical protein ONB46_04400 [candidate division KSB1 bacterium]|nr:hypothetical protein [candidate division KSB1 bacterium]MDZ7365139.1 hypothetical protein [candidate division KSB1 bacterium]MDZ7404349.1 hypothetical protein [candidate division KSB1 bacterium]
MFYYLDTAPIIYLVEKITPFYERASERLRKPEILLATSTLSRLETSSCDVFLTSDHRLDRCTEIKTEILE